MSIYVKRPAPVRAIEADFVNMISNGHIMAQGIQEAIFSEHGISAVYNYHCLFAMKVELRNRKSRYTLKDLQQRRRKKYNPGFNFFVKNQRT